MNYWENDDPFAGFPDEYESQPIVGGTTAKRPGTGVEFKLGDIDNPLNFATEADMASNPHAGADAIWQTREARNFAAGAALRIGMDVGQVRTHLEQMFGSNAYYTNVGDQLVSRFGRTTQGGISMAENTLQLLEQSVKQQYGQPYMTTSNTINPLTNEKQIVPAEPKWEFMHGNPARQALMKSGRQITFENQAKPNELQLGDMGVDVGEMANLPGYYVDRTTGELTTGSAGSKEAKRVKEAGMGKNELTFQNLPVVQHPIATQAGGQGTYVKAPTVMLLGKTGAFAEGQGLYDPDVTGPGQRGRPVTVTLPDELPDDFEPNLQVGQRIDLNNHRFEIAPGVGGRIAGASAFTPTTWGIHETTTTLKTGQQRRVRKLVIQGEADYEGVINTKVLGEKTASAPMPNMAARLNLRIGDKPLRGIAHIGVMNQAAQQAYAQMINLSPDELEQKTGSRTWGLETAKKFWQDQLGSNSRVDMVTMTQQMYLGPAGSDEYEPQLAAQMQAGFATINRDSIIEREGSRFGAVDMTVPAIVGETAIMGKVAWPYHSRQISAEQLEKVDLVDPERAAAIREYSTRHNQQAGRIFGAALAAQGQAPHYAVVSGNDVVARWSEVNALGMEMAENDVPFDLREGVDMYGQAAHTLRAVSELTGGAGIEINPADYGATGDKFYMPDPTALLAQYGGGEVQDQLFGMPMTAYRVLEGMGNPERNERQQADLQRNMNLFQEQLSFATENAEARRQLEGNVEPRIGGQIQVGEDLAPAEAWIPENRLADAVRQVWGKREWGGDLQDKYETPEAAARAMLMGETEMLPDMFIGRWPINDMEDVNNVVRPLTYAQMNERSGGNLSYEDANRMGVLVSRQAGQAGSGDWDDDPRFISMGLRRKREDMSVLNERMATRAAESVAKEQQKTVADILAAPKTPEAAVQAAIDSIKTVSTQETAENSQAFERNKGMMGPAYNATERALEMFAMGKPGTPAEKRKRVEMAARIQSEVGAPMYMLAQDAEALPDAAKGFIEQLSYNAETKGYFKRSGEEGDKSGFMADFLSEQVRTITGMATELKVSPEATAGMLADVNSPGFEDLVGAVQSGSAPNIIKQLAQMSRARGEQNTHNGIIGNSPAMRMTMAYGLNKAARYTKDENGNRRERTDKERQDYLRNLSPFQRELEEEGGLVREYLGAQSRGSSTRQMPLGSYVKILQRMVEKGMMSPERMTTLAKAFQSAGVMPGQAVASPGEQAPSNLSESRDFLRGVKGIGEATSQALIDKWGGNLPTILANERYAPLLQEAKGIGPKRAASIQAAYREQFRGRLTTGYFNDPVTGEKVEGLRPKLEQLEAHAAGDSKVTRPAIESAADKLFDSLQFDAPSPTIDELQSRLDAGQGDDYTNAVKQTMDAGYEIHDGKVWQQGEYQQSLGTPASTAGSGQQPPDIRSLALAGFGDESMPDDQRFRMLVQASHDAYMQNPGQTGNRRLRSLHTQFMRAGDKASAQGVIDFARQMGGADFYNEDDGRFQYANYLRSNGLSQPASKQQSVNPTGTPPEPPAGTSTPTTRQQQAQFAMPDSDEFDMGNSPEAFLGKYRKFAEEGTIYKLVNSVDEFGRETSYSVKTSSTPNPQDIELMNIATGYNREGTDLAPGGEDEQRRLTATATAVQSGTAPTTREDLQYSGRLKTATVAVGRVASQLYRTERFNTEAAKTASSIAQRLRDEGKNDEADQFLAEFQNLQGQVDQTAHSEASALLHRNATAVGIPLAYNDQITLKKQVDVYRAQGRNTVKTKQELSEAERVANAQGLGKLMRDVASGAVSGDNISLRRLAMEQYGVTPTTSVMGVVDRIANRTRLTAGQVTTFQKYGTVSDTELQQWQSSTSAISDDEKRKRASERMAQQVQLNQKKQAAARVTIKARKNAQLELIDKRAAVNNQTRNAELTDKARTLAARAGVDFEQVMQQAKATGQDVPDVVGFLQRTVDSQKRRGEIQVSEAKADISLDKKERAVEIDEKQRQAQLLDRARGLAGELGIPFEQVEREMTDTGEAPAHVVGRLREQLRGKRRDSDFRNSRLESDRRSEDVIRHDIERSDARESREQARRVISDVRQSAREKNWDNRRHEKQAEKIAIRDEREAHQDERRLERFEQEDARKVANRRHRTANKRITNQGQLDVALSQVDRPDITPADKAAYQEQIAAYYSQGNDEKQGVVRASYSDSRGMLSVDIEREQGAIINLAKGIASGSVKSGTLAQNLAAAREQGVVSKHGQQVVAQLHRRKLTASSVDELAQLGVDTETLDKLQPNQEYTDIREFGGREAVGNLQKARSAALSEMRRVSAGKKGSWRSTSGRGRLLERKLRQVEQLDRQLDQIGDAVGENFGMSDEDKEFIGQAKGQRALQQTKQKTIGRLAVAGGGRDSLQHEMGELSQSMLNELREIRKHTKNSSEYTKRLAESGSMNTGRRELNRMVEEAREIGGESGVAKLLGTREAKQLMRVMDGDKPMLTNIGLGIRKMFSPLSAEGAMVRGMYRAGFGKIFDQDIPNAMQSFMGGLGAALSGGGGFALGGGGGGMRLQSRAEGVMRGETGVVSDLGPMAQAIMRRNQRAYNQGQAALIGEQAWGWTQGTGGMDKFQALINPAASLGMSAFMGAKVLGLGSVAGLAGGIAGIGGLAMAAGMYGTNSAKNNAFNVWQAGMEQDVLKDPNAGIVDKLWAFTSGELRNFGGRINENGGLNSFVNGLLGIEQTQVPQSTTSGGKGINGLQSGVEQSGQQPPSDIPVIGVDVLYEGQTTPNEPLATTAESSDEQTAQAARPQVNQQIAPGMSMTELGETVREKAPTVGKALLGGLVAVKAAPLLAPVAGVLGRAGMVAGASALQATGIGGSTATLGGGLAAAGALALPAAILAGGYMVGHTIDEVGQVTTGRSFGQNLTELGQITAYGAGSLFGKGEEWFEATGGTNGIVAEKPTPTPVAQPQPKPQPQNNMWDVAKNTAWAFLTNRDNILTDMGEQLFITAGEVATIGQMRERGDVRRDQMANAGGWFNQGVYNRYEANTVASIREYKQQNALGFEAIVNGLLQAAVEYGGYRKPTPPVVPTPEKTLAVDVSVEDIGESADSRALPDTQAGPLDAYNERVAAVTATSTKAQETSLWGVSGMGAMRVAEARGARYTMTQAALERRAAIQEQAIPNPFEEIARLAGRGKALQSLRAESLNAMSLATRGVTQEYANESDARLEQDYWSLGVGDRMMANTDIATRLQRADSTFKLFDTQQLATGVQTFASMTGYDANQLQNGFNSIGDKQAATMLMNNMAGVWDWNTVAGISRMTNAGGAGMFDIAKQLDQFKVGHPGMPQGSYENAASQFSFLSQSGWSATDVMQQAGRSGEQTGMNAVNLGRMAQGDRKFISEVVMGKNVALDDDMRSMLEGQYQVQLEDKLGMTVGQTGELSNLVQGINMRPEAARIYERILSQQPGMAAALSTATTGSQIMAAFTTGGGFENTVLDRVSGDSLQEITDMYSQAELATSRAARKRQRANFKSQYGVELQDVNAADIASSDYVEQPFASIEDIGGTFQRQRQLGLAGRRLGYAQTEGGTYTDERGVQSTFTGQWGFQDEERDVSRALWSEQYQRQGVQRGLQRGFELTQREWTQADMSRDYERGGIRLDWQEQDLLRQKAQMGRGNEYQLWNLNWQQQMTGMQRGWQQEDWAFQRGQAQMQYGWQMEDVDEDIRFATGRQRKKLLKQKKRATISQNISEERQDTQEERAKETWAMEDEKFAKEKEHLLESQRINDENWTIQMERLQTQRQWFEEDHATQLERFSKRVEYEENIYKLQEEAYQREIEIETERREREDKRVEEERAIYEENKRLAEETRKVEEEINLLNINNSKTELEMSLAMQASAEAVRAFTNLMGTMQQLASTGFFNNFNNLLAGMNSTANRATATTTTSGFPGYD